MEAKAYTKEEIAAVADGDTEYSSAQCPECGQDCDRWLATLAEAEREVARANARVAALEAVNADLWVALDKESARLKDGPQGFGQYGESK